MNNLLDKLFGMGLSTKARFFRQLSTMLQSGLPLMSMLDALSRDPNGKIRKVAQESARIVGEGNQLSQGLARFPDYFEDYIIKLVQAGEVGGALEVHMESLADYLERMVDQRNKLITKMLYPIVVFHLAFFIPTLPVLILGGIIPYLLASFVPLLHVYAFCFFVYVVYKALCQIPGFKMTLDTVSIHIPFIAGYFRAKAAFRFMMVLGQLAEAGIPLALAVETSAKACGNEAAGQIFMRIKKAVNQGGSFTEAARSTGMFTEMALQLISTGEMSGKLPFMLTKAADLLEQHLNDVIMRVFTIIPILLYLVVAAFVGFIVISFFVKFYSGIVNMP